MCGIVGSIRRSEPVLAGLVAGLRALEYRGYDSSGVAVGEPQGILVRRKAGRLEALEAELADGALARSTVGIGHTRWATHGPPTDANAHPHTDGSGRLALVHNGVIENHAELRRELSAAGVVFHSDTDTETLVHLVGRELADGAPRAPGEGALSAAVRRALAHVSGYYAIAVLRIGERPELVCARHGPPLCVGATAEGAWLASDVLGLVPYTREVVFLDDGDVAELAPGSVIVRGLDGALLERPARRVDWSAEDAALGTFPHFMLKEIHEQPDVLARTAFERIDDDAGDVRLFDGGPGEELLAGLQRLVIVACGTAHHAGLVTRYLVEGLAGLPVEVDYASEFRYRGPVLTPGTAALAVSQSGETADTLAALRLARSLGARTLAICNVRGSTLAREAEGLLLTHAGPEIGVASTKAFVAQLVAGYLLAVRLGRIGGRIDLERGRSLLQELRLLRPALERLLSEHTTQRVQAIAERHQDARGFLFLGRGLNYPIALEGALKLKEISYVHAEGYPAGEMKHGPIALVEPGLSTVVLASRGAVADKVRSNIEQVRARGGRVICIGSDPGALELADEALEVPESSEWLSPILNVVPLQLLAYHVALLKGCDIDKPRNLAKSVTVE